MSSKWDIIVIGAGILGLSSAYHIKRLNPQVRILVIDQLGGAGQGNTAKSAGGYRNVLASEKNRVLAESTIDWFNHLQEDRGYDIKLTRIGYFWLLNEERFSKVKNVFRRMEEEGVELEFFEKEEIKKMVPGLVTDLDDEGEFMGLESLDVGVLGVRCGTIDTDALSRAIEKEYVRIGGEVRYNTRADRLILKPETELEIPGEPFVWQDSRIKGVETNRGEILADTTIVAAGVWSERLLDPIGLDSMMRPKKRVVFVFKDPRLDPLFNVKGLNEHNVLPLTHIPSLNIYMKPDLVENSIWLACADSFGRKYGLEDDPQPERELYTEDIYHALVKHFPCFRDLRPINMWAGQRAVNSFDLIPVVNPAPGMIYVGAATGNGILKSDALGRIVASMYSGNESAELYGGRRIKVTDLGVDERDLERETFRV
jgi:glycine/D-amino acid oxidase-like deaminating enzyme